MKKLMSGSDAVAEAVKMANVDVISAYPITPQTHIIEKLANMCATGELDATYINVESEHSAMAALVGAATAGARTFTATASQGLALMHEMLHWAGNGRVPIVMAVVNRAMAPGWNIWTDQTDSLSQRDTGWIQLYCNNAQDVFDHTLMAFPLAFMTHLPVMVVQDAYLLSHTYESVEIPTQEQADEYIQVLDPMDFTIDFDNPASIWQLTMPEDYSRFRRKLQRDMDDVDFAYASEAGVFARHFGRKHSLTEVYTLTQDKIQHKNLLITTGTITNTARAYVDAAKRFDTAVCNLRMLRPFKPQGLAGWAAKADRVIVIDRNLSPGLGGIWAQEVKAWLSPYKRESSSAYTQPVQVYSYIAGMGGVDVTEETIERILNHAETDGECLESYFVEDI